MNTNKNRFAYKLGRFLAAHTEITVCCTLVVLAVIYLGFSREAGKQNAEELKPLNVVVGLPLQSSTAQTNEVAIDCSKDNAKSTLCTDFRERVKKEDERRLATFKAVNEANPAASISSAVSVTENPRIGMSQMQALASTWGTPKKINTTTTALGKHEQWVYNEGYLYFVDGVLTTIQN